MSFTVLNSKYKYGTRKKKKWFTFGSSESYNMLVFMGVDKANHTLVILVHGPFQGKYCSTFFSLFDIASVLSKS